VERVRRLVGDPGLVLAALGLSLFGVAMIYSAGVVNVPSLVAGAWQRQLVWLALALAFFMVSLRVPSRWVEWGAFPAYVLTLILLAATLVVGTGAGTAAGVKSWIRIGPVGIQPAELAKLATVLALARFLAVRREPPTALRDLLAPSSLVAVPMFMVLLQPDLGTALAFVGILFAVLYWAGTPLPLLLLLASPGLALLLSFSTLVWSGYILLLMGGLYLYRYRLFAAESVAAVLINVAAGTVAQPLWNSLADYQRNRLLVFLDPSVDPRGAGWHLVQSKVAIGSGGIFGKGFTEGTQKRLAFLPEQHTDFIFSVVGEELGFVGVLLALVGFGYLLYRLVRMAEKTLDPFAGLVLFGIFGAWLVHVFINIGMTVGLVPVTGIPLPFISYGGSFLVVSWIAVATAVRVMDDT
jgi:rod shape determining protein RodA